MAIVVRYSEAWRKKVGRGWFKRGLTSHNKGIPMSIEQKEKISKSLKGRSAWNKGTKMTEEQKKKLSEISKGMHYSPKTEFKGGNFSVIKILLKIQLSEKK